MFSFLSHQQIVPGAHWSDFLLSSDGRTVTDVLQVHKILDKVASDYTLVIKNSIQTLFPLPPPTPHILGGDLSDTTAVQPQQIQVQV